MPIFCRNFTVQESALENLEYAADGIHLKKEHSYFYIQCWPKSFCVKHNLHTLQYDTKGNPY